MKKILAVLAVLVFLTASVFAESEVHSIIVRATVSEVLPVFQLTRSQFIGRTSAGSDFTTPAETSNAAGAVFSDGQRYDLTELEVGDLSRNDIAISFSVNVGNAAKTVKTFTLAFSAGNFSVSRNGVSGVLMPSEHTVEAAGASRGVITSYIGEDEIQAVFNGTTLDPSTSLGTYTVVYEKDPTIDPSEGNTTGASYTAAITLTITV